MNIFSKFLKGLKYLFAKVRPGLEEFLQDYLETATVIARRVITEHFGLTIEDFKNTNGAISKIESAVKAAVWESLNASGKHPGNWVSILTSYALEALKRE